LISFTPYQLHPMSKKIILVPVDFTKATDCAINHAIKVASSNQSEISLLHLVAKKDLLDEAKIKLSACLERVLPIANGIKVNTIARVGTIFENIGDVAEELECSLIIMGTHGLRGLQFITGSNALKIVTSSKTPIIIVQEKNIDEKGYSNIVVPLELEKEAKQKLNYVVEMANYFNSNIHIIVPKETDEYLVNQIDRNLAYAKQFFQERSIEHTSHISEYASSDFDKGIIKYAAAIQADLIAVMNYEDSSLINLFTGSFVQHIITNEAQIPALVINPKSTSDISVFGNYSGNFS
jgi:nucleotide-binding universal stress UspA family protein